MTLRNIFLIDGATGSELDRRGVDISMPLWSARALIEAPEPPKILKQVHLDYLNAGAQAITANTFRAHKRSLAKAGIGDQAKELTQLAVAIARSARHQPRDGAGLAPSGLQRSIDPVSHRPAADLLHHG